MAKVSIITPSFNRAEVISETLDSLISQTFSDWENIIVDDGSTDETNNIIKSYAKKDSRIKLYKRDRIAQGAGSCRNQGVDLCTGDLILFLDTDDILEPFCIEQRSKVMLEDPSLDFAIFSSLVFQHEPYDSNLLWNIDKKHNELVRQLHLDVICPGSGVIWRKAAFNQLGQWNIKLSMWQDVELFLYAYINQYKYKKCLYLPPDLHIRESISSISRTGYYSKDKIDSRIAVVKTAMRLLKSTGMDSYLSECYWMLTGGIGDAIMVREWKVVMTLIQLGRKYGVIDRGEELSILALVLVHFFRINKLPFVNNEMSFSTNKKLIESTIGKVSYK